MSVFKEMANFISFEKKKKIFALKQQTKLLIHLLDPLLVRMDPVPASSWETDTNQQGSLCCYWSCPALNLTRRRYAESESTVTAGFLAVPSGPSRGDYSTLRWTARFLSVVGSIKGTRLVCL